VSDWLSLRDHLRLSAEAFVDDLIQHDPDRQLRARLAAHREQVLERLVDQAEAVVLRRMLAQREQEQAEPPGVIKLNGHAPAHRVMKVAGRG
jgi:hypothetical protein